MRAYQKYIAEFAGTFLLTFAIICNAAGKQNKGTTNSWVNGDPVWGVAAVGCTLMVLVYALAGVSGAHLNPAVSIALGITKSVEGGWAEVCVYCLVQTVAGILAACFGGFLLIKEVHVGPPEGFSWRQACIAEMFMTCMLCFVVLNVATLAKSGRQFYGLAIGFTIIAAGYGGGRVSGGCFNPAANFGINLSNGIFSLGYGLVYCLFNIAGAALAAGLFKTLRAVDATPEGQPFAGTAPSKNSAAAPLAELVGTFFLVLTVGLNVLSNSPATVLSISAALMVMIFSLGDISGAHFNPAVTFAILLSGRKAQTDLRPAQAGVYIVSQVIGGVLGALLFGYLEWNSFGLSYGKGFRLGHAMFAEFLFTFLLCFVVLCVATVLRKSEFSEFAGLAIGFCVMAGGMAIGKVSGGVLNPAVAISIALTHGGHLWWFCIPYAIAQLLAGAAAAGMFFLTHPEEYYIKGTTWDGVTV